jgi:hypothetical protein
LTHGSEKGNKAVIDKGGKLINIKIDGTNPKCVSAQNKLIKAMTSENINILNAMIILF